MHLPRINRVGAGTPVVGRVRKGSYPNELFQQPEYQLQDEQSERQVAQMYTKALHNGDAWDHLARLIGIGDPATMTVATEVSF